MNRSAAQIVPINGSFARARYYTRGQGVLPSRRYLARYIAPGSALLALSCLLAISILAPLAALGAPAPEGRPSPAEKESRRRALRELGSRADAASERALEAALADEDPRARGTAARELGRRAGARALDRLVELLGSEDAPTRWGAIEALGGRGDRAATGALLGVLGHPDAATRWKAAEALGRLGDPRAAQALGRQAGVEAHVPARHAMIDAVAAIGGPQARAALQDLSASRDARARARAALGRMSDGNER